jgi:internalin A
MREADQEIADPAQRRHRRLSQQEFVAICAEEGGVSEPAQLLQFLNNSDVLFYRKGLFNDAIVLDHAWALDAIYAVFNRDRCYRQLLKLCARFTRPLLEALAWEKHSVDEQKLFLSMMESCGICFVHRRNFGTSDPDDTEYIAPDLLPDRSAVALELEEKWHTDQSAETVNFTYSFLHAGLMRGVIVRIGGQAGMNGLYWKGGLCAYETRTRSHALVEQEMSGDWAGTIRVRAQGGKARELLEMVADEIEEENELAGLQPERTDQPIMAHRLRKGRIRRQRKKTFGQPEVEATAQFGPTPRTEPAWYVSYAWGDTTPEGRKREKVVNFLCEEARKVGKPIHRDKEEVGFGEGIEKFMTQLARADRVFIVLSDKYLKSTFCMSELLAAWRKSESDPDVFLRNARIYSLPDAKIGSSKERLPYSAHWKREHDELQQLIRENEEAAGLQAHRELLFMRRLDVEAADILASIANTVHPTRLDDIDKLRKYWFEELNAS